MSLPTRRTIWLSAALLLVVMFVSLWLLAPRSRITQANCDRIHEQMDIAEVESILGESGQWYVYAPIGGNVRLKDDERPSDWAFITYELDDGPNSIGVFFMDGRVARKSIYLATAWQTFTWYAKKGAEKIGIKWD